MAQHGSDTDFESSGCGLESRRLADKHGALIQCCVGLVLARCLCRHNIVSALDWRLVFAGSALRYHTSPASTSREQVFFLGWPSIVDAGPAFERHLFGVGKYPVAYCIERHWHALILGRYMFVTLFQN